jgi:crotonobetaine/carnitine-CoA ligase
MSILYTSGTTGPSKGAILSHHYYYYNLISAIHWMRHTEDDVLYTCLPFFHANASICSVYTALMAKATFAMGKRFSLTTFLDEIAMCKATHTNVMGSILVLLMKQEPKPDDAHNTLKVINSVPLIPESLEFEKRFGVKLIGMFGATETCICIASPFGEVTKPDSCGKALPQYDCRIFDDNDMECAPGVKGEIVVRGKEPFIQMEGYYNMPEATLKTFRNLWYHTGDFGMRDEDGYFYFLDRKKDAIRRRGENISSYEVEEVANSHPAVLESAAVAVKDAEMTEDEVKICVILKKGQKLAPEELINFCKERMAYYMVPRYVDFMDEFPKTPNQKIQKFILRDKGLTSETWDREKAGMKVER